MSQTTDRPQRTDDTSSSTPSPETETVLAVDDLRKTYGDGEDAVTAVDGVSLEVDRGEVVGVLGPNGAGKTTTIKSILGLVVPSSGSVEIAGVDADDDPRGVYRHVGAMLEGARNVYWKLTVRENLEFFAALGGNDPDAARSRHDKLLDQFNLAEKADDAVNELSRGQKQKVSLAATLARGTDVVFLDEPTLGLDIEASLELRRELRRLADEDDITVVLSSHDMDVVEDVCDRVVILSDGRVIADDSVEELVGVLETQAYRVVAAGQLPGELRSRLVRDYRVENFEVLDDRTRFDVTLGDDDSLHGVLGVLDHAGHDLLDVDGLEPDLEDVFLDVTGRASGGDGR
ncbi:ABC transporter ATP-binding protein [Halobacterium jilantaiense]|uniref:ABC-2 type transport system ATP-binding protein n=1 Tax=Halobacterium jilantaiense TaxID=355548 RepID=A0A1I0NH09_9EURY|nr:ABC transporter ATP-binding protein [Halobacterium jilantaiense]SEW00053.1 ABC-2 type transport system ATP-binding protein [Halobacterium jilantaiense]